MICNMFGRVIVVLFSILPNAKAVSSCGSSTSFIYQSGTYTGYSFSGGQACLACPSSNYIVLGTGTTQGSYTCYSSSNVQTSGGRCCACPDGTGPYGFPSSGNTLSTDWTQSSLCGTCPAGSYGSSELYVRGNSNSCSTGGCYPCPPGYYQPTAGQTSCIACPSQTPYTFAYGSVSVQTSSSSYGGSATVGPMLLSDCVALPDGYAISTLVVSSTSCSSYGYAPGSYSIATACPIQFQITTSALSDCAYCPAGKFFFSKSTNLMNANSGSNTNINYYGDYSWNNWGTQTLTGMPSTVYSASVSINRPAAYGASCVSTCPDGYQVAPYGQTLACDPCNKYNSYSGFTSGFKYGTGGKCDVCPFNSYAAQPAATSCTLCQYPWTGMNTPSSSSPAITCSPFKSPLCLCVAPGSVAAICLCIAAFYLFLLFVFLCCRKRRPPVSAGSELVNMSATEEAPKEDETLKPENTQKAEEDDRDLDITNNYRLLFGLMTYILVPFVDNITDLAFIIQNQFFSFTLFIVFVACFVMPALMFCKALSDKGARPRFYLVSMPARLIFDKYDSLWKVMLGVALVTPFALLNSPVLLPQLVSGCLLYSTKAFSIKPIANTWLHIWTGARFAKAGTPEAEERDRQIEDAFTHPIDERVLNESIYSHIIFETFPLVVIQFINNQSFGSWNGLAIFSMAFSIFNAMSGVYRIVYFRLIKGIPLVAIPVDFSIAGVDLMGHRLAQKLATSETEDLEKEIYKDSDHVAGSPNGHDDRVALLLQKHSEEIGLLKSRVATLEHSMEKVSATGQASLL